jgi:hypothetical protein
VANPILIGGLVIGGTLAALRLAHDNRDTLRKLLKAIRSGDGRKDSGPPVPLEQDPATGIYRPKSARLENDRGGMERP